MRVSEGSILMFWKDEGFTSHGAAAFSFSGSELLAPAQSSEDVSMASIVDNSQHLYSNSQSFFGNTSTLFYPPPASSTGFNMNASPQVTSRGVAPLDMERSAFPFTGSCCLRSWNAQALLAADPKRRRLKWTHCRGLLRGADALAIQETHGTPEGVAMSRGFPEARIWWSHETQAIGGIALAIRSTFLDQFWEPAGESLLEVVPGRAAILRLDGPSGSIDIGVVYLPTGAAKGDRDRIQTALAKALRPAQRALTVLVGDWNFVRETEDRMNLADAGWTGQADITEHDQWTEAVFHPFSFYEAWQAEMTHRTTLGTSRLDRAYVNGHSAEQQYAAWGTTALAWCPHLSTHRPLEVARRMPGPVDQRRTPAPTGPSRHPAWPSKVTLRWNELRKHDDQPDSVHRQLVLLKQAMAEVSRDMFKRGQVGQAVLCADKIGATIRCLRAVQQGRDLAIRRACEEYPELLSIGSLETLVRGGQEMVHHIKEHILFLAKTDIREELETLNQESPDLPEAQISIRRQAISAKIAKLKPGGRRQLQAIKTSDGNVVTDPKTMAQALKQHWEPTFTAAPINEALLRIWLRELQQHPSFTPLDGLESNWQIQRSDVAWAIKHAKTSSPGPDGLSAAHWRAMGKTAEDVILAAAASLSQENASQEIQTAYRDADSVSNLFNRSILCCIPKGDGEEDALHGRSHEAGQTRPLSLVDVSNRIIAAAYKKRWEPQLGAWVSIDQRGFIQGRSMMKNVVDLEAAGFSTSALHERGMTLLIDFKAAFPSVSHQFMMLCLKAMGMPASMIRVLQALYLDGHCCISVGGALWEGFSMTSGIRQGCPLSPLIFAVVMDVLLRRLTSNLTGSHVHKAFADDVGVVLSDLDNQLAALVAILDSFEVISGMQVNVSKTVGIPLWPCELTEASLLIGTLVPRWSTLPLRFSAIYLGCLIGPQKDSAEWKGALAKFQDRIRDWPWSKLGLHFATTVYNTYAMSVLGFIAQIANPTEQTRKVEAAGLRRAAPGPGNWATPTDLWNLHQLGMPRPFRSLEVMAKAAKLRLYTSDNARHGGLKIDELYAAVWAAGSELTFPARTVWWFNGFRNSIIAVLVDNARALAAQGINGKELLRSLGAKLALSHTPLEAARKAHSQLQRAITQAVQRTQPYNLHFRVREKLLRWDLGDNQRIHAERFTRHLHMLQQQAPPRITAAVISTGWNRWCTARRFQTRHSPLNICQLGCGGEAEDSVEHYARCPVVRDCHAAILDLHAPWLLPGWLGTGESTRTGCPMRYAIGAYATYRTTNTARSLGGFSAEATKRAFRIAVTDATAGQGKVMAALRGRMRGLEDVEKDEPLPAPRRRRVSR